MKIASKGTAKYLVSLKGTSTLRNLVQSLAIQWGIYVGQSGIGTAFIHINLGLNCKYNFNDARTKFNCPLPHLAKPKPTQHKQM
jgi:hypothetical protein